MSWTLSRLEQRSAVRSRSCSMPTRRFHGKTTTGCTACKRRHVKCDEARPVCKNCTRRQETCSYTIVEETRSSTSGSIPDYDGKSSTSSPNGRTHHLYDGLDLTLMHRYSTVTSIHLFPTEGGRQVWQDFVPARSETCDVLQRGMLALAAMDLALQCSTSPEASLLPQAAIYRERALHHQQAALPGFRDLIQSPDLQDRTAAFLFSVMLIILAFGTAHSATTKPTLEDVLNFFALFRGPKTLWQLHGDVANAELVETMSPKPVASPPYPSDKDETLKDLKDLVLDDACAEAVAILNAAWDRFDANRTDVRSIAFFPAMASEAYYALLRRRDPNALRILTHYAMLLSKFRSRWWIGAWDKILLDAISPDNDAATKGLVT